MLDAVTLDQIRTFLAAIDEGSFSAASRRLGRAQSVVSQTLANLEAQLGLSLFDRSRRKPIPTAHGRALLPEARSLVAGIDALKARARSLARGLEPELSIVADVMFPIKVLTPAVSAFQAHFPDTPLRLYVEVLGAVVDPVVKGTCAFGIMGSLPKAPEAMTCERLMGVPMTMVVAPSHPLASVRGAIPTPALERYVQLVLTDRSNLTAGREFGVMSSRTWRLADLGAKHAFLRAGLGWGGMPLDAVEDDLAAGHLVRLTLEDGMPDGFVMPMSAIYPTDRPPGPAARWMIDRLRANA